MHYDSEKGSRVLDGLFSKKTIIVMIVCMVLAGLYSIFTFYAPEIFRVSSGEKYAIENRAMNEHPIESQSILFMPSTGIEVIVSTKKSPGNVLQWHDKRGNVKIIAEQKIVGVTPWETLRLSPLFGLSGAEVGDYLYLDIEGMRRVYKVIKIDSEETQGSDEIIVQTTDDSDNVIYSLVAEIVGNMEWKDGKAVVVVD